MYLSTVYGGKIHAAEVPYSRARCSGPARSTEGS